MQNSLSFALLLVVTTGFASIASPDNARPLLFHLGATAIVLVLAKLFRDRPPPDHIDDHSVPIAEPKRKVVRAYRPSANSRPPSTIDDRHGN